MTNSDPLAVEYVPAGEVRTHPSNPRQGDVGAIHQSITKNGVYRPLIVQRSTGFILAGNHTYQAMVHHGLEEVPVVYRDVNEEQAKRIMLADNRTADLGDYDQQVLVDMLTEMEDLEGTGYDGDDLDSILEDLRNSPADEQPHAEDIGERLALMDVTFGPPEHEVENGQTWTVGRHILFVGDLAHDHVVWADYLEGRVFAPYPEPYLTCSTLAEEEDLLLVQPNPFLAGHLLDAHAQAFPGDKVEVRA